MCPGRSESPSGVLPRKPIGSSGCPSASLISGRTTSPPGAVTAVFTDRSGCQSGSFAFSGCIASVTRHQTIMTTPITVVAPMIFSALSLDSWMPLMFTRQK